MQAPRHLDWEHFRTTVLVRGERRVHRVAEAPLTHIFSDGESDRIGIWLEVPPNTGIPAELMALSTISLRIVQKEGHSFVEVATATTSLFRQFYHFAVAVAERYVVEKLSAIDAIATEIECFSELLEQKALLGIERQIGLLGELIFLERLILVQGLGAVDSWLGPLREPHDFRLHDREFEVKTTVSTRRVHTIHGLEQLVPSANCSLYIISVLLGPAGLDSGFSLPEKVHDVSQLLVPASVRQNQFQHLLDSTGFRVLDEPHYQRRFALRRPLAVIPVDNDCPALTRTAIRKGLGALTERVESLQYDLNLEGLEQEDGTSGFRAVVPN